MLLIFLYCIHNFYSLCLISANSRNSRLDTSNLSDSNDLDEKSDSVDNSGASGGSTNTVIFNPSNGMGIEKSPSTGQMMMPMWNPVLDRLMGNNKQAQLRNESYYKVLFI